MRIDAPPKRSPVMLASEHARTVRGIIDSVLPNAEVRVFGSRATGRSRPFSDLDLLLIRPPRLSWQERADLRDRFEASELPFGVDLVELDSLPVGMVERVTTESAALPGG